MAKTAISRRYIVSFISILSIGLVLITLLPKVDSFNDSLRALQSASLLFASTAFIISLCACLCAALIYKTLIARRVSLVNLLLVQLSGLFVNRILPAGVGGIGLNIWYLRQERLKLADATLILTANTVLGFLATCTLITIAVTTKPSTIFLIFNDFVFNTWATIAFTLVVLIIIVLYNVYKARIANKIRTIITSLQKAKRTLLKHPKRLAMAFLLACLLAACNGLSFWFCCQALELSISMQAAFLIITGSVLLGTATPTPGGLGGVEAALVAGLIAFDSEASVALAAALLYRLVSYWLGLLVGCLALVCLKFRLS